MNKKQFGSLISIAVNITIIAGLVLSLFISAKPIRALGTIRYAIPGGATSGSCNSWGTACELRYVLTMVAVSGDQIWVKAGTYKPTSGTDRSISFVLLNGVAIYGGFNGTETLLSQRDPAANVTILSGEIGTPETSDNSLHVIIGSGTNNTAVLDGFTITAGNATNDKGGGMWNYGGSPTLANLIFSANSARYGGGMYNENASNPILINVIFDNNQANINGSDAAGGGMYNDNS